jgi:hypothetical protein
MEGVNPPAAPLWSMGRLCCDVLAVAGPNLVGFWGSRSCIGCGFGGSMARPPRIREGLRHADGRRECAAGHLHGMGGGRAETS